MHTIVFMVGEITFLTYSVNNINEHILTLNMTEYIANTANMPGTEENSARFSSGKKKVHFL